MGPSERKQDEILTGKRTWGWMGGRPGMGLPARPSQWSPRMARTSSDNMHECGQLELTQPCVHRDFVGAADRPRASPLPPALPGVKTSQGPAVAHTVGVDSWHNPRPQASWDP